MSNDEFLHEIANLRKQYLAKIDDEENNSQLINQCEELRKWQKQIMNELEKFIEKKIHELKQKYFEINQQKLRYLDNLYSNYLSNHIGEHNKQYYSQLIKDYQNRQLSIEIFHPKQIDFNSYLQLNTNHLTDIQHSSTLINTNTHLNLLTYQLFSTVSIQSNLTPLFATYDRLLIYYDHHTTTSSSLDIFDLKNYLEHSNNNNHSGLKLRVPCKQFQGKLMHIEYNAYLKEFLLATSSKLFILEIPNTVTNYHIIEYFDIVHSDFPGVLQKFACHLITPNLIYLLINTLSVHILVQIDLNKNFYVRKKWNYPKDDISNTLTDNHTSQLKNINDFILGKDMLIFAVTYQLNDHLSYQLHIRSSDMHLQHYFILNSTLCPLHMCIIPCDYSLSSWNEQEQFLLIYQNSKILSLYNFNLINKIQLIDEIILNTEPEYIGFANNDSSILLLRNFFHIAIYKQQMNNNNNTNNHDNSNTLLPIGQRLSFLTHKQ